MTWAIKPHPMTPTLSRPAISTPSEYVGTFHRPYRKGSAVSTPWGGLRQHLFGGRVHPGRNFALDFSQTYPRVTVQSLPTVSRQDNSHDGLSHHAMYCDTH